MASIITLDGVGATNEWGEEIATGFTWGLAAQTFVGWGIVAFALGTAAFRARDAFRGFRRSGSSAPVQGWFGRRRRRRR
jgi:hypothetical protein